MKIIITIIPSYKFTFTLFLSFLENRKQESGFQQFGSLITRNILRISSVHVLCHQKTLLNRRQWLQLWLYIFRSLPQNYSLTRVDKFYGESFSRRLRYLIYSMAISNIKYIILHWLSHITVFVQIKNSWTNF